MRVSFSTYPAVCLAAFVWFLGFLHAGDYVMVPDSLDEVINPNFQQALVNNAPDYNSLSRGDQVAAYTRVYKSLNRGQNPALLPGDAEHLGLPPLVGGGLTLPQVPQDYVNPRSGDAYVYYPGYGYHRYPAPSVAVPPYPGTVNAPSPGYPHNDGYYVYDEYSDDYFLDDDIRAMERRVPHHRLEPRHPQPRHLQPRHLESRLPPSHW